MRESSPRAARKSVNLPHRQTRSRKFLPIAAGVFLLTGVLLQLTREELELAVTGLCLQFGGLALLAVAIALQVSSSGERNSDADTNELPRALLEAMACWAHEMRTPLTAVTGFTQLLQQYNATPEDKLDAIRSIDSCSKHMQSLIGDTLDIARLARGEINIDMARCATVEFLKDIQRIAGSRADEAGLKLSIRSEGPIPEFIETDVSRLRQILINLVVNAIKFTREGSIRVVARLLAPTHDAADNNSSMIQFEVIDTGIGMTPQQLSGLFVPFRQVGGVNSQRLGGVGLGLVISRKLAELLGGTLEVDSRVGEGSRFKLQIPTGPLNGVKNIEGIVVEKKSLREEAANSSSPEARVALPGGSRILLADDAEPNRRLFQRIIELAGGEVVLAENGEQAYQAVFASGSGSEFSNKPAFDVVVLDIEMPVMGGLEAVRKIRAAGFDLPVIALTAHDTSSLRQECSAAGFSDFITKPVERQEFLTSLVSWIDLAKLVTVP